MPAYQRKTAPGVSGGKVQKKNSWHTTHNYYDHTYPLPAVDRRRPGPGFRHLLTKEDIYKFIEILPDWPDLSVGLNAIVIDAGSHRRYGWHTPGVVHVCAWRAEMWEFWPAEYYERNKSILHRLEVPCEADELATAVKWTEPTARAFLLLDVLLHELGHHHDRMTTKSKVDSARGEPYAEAYAVEYMDRIWSDYVKRFPLY
jgi:hypothetical protein